MHSLIRSAQAFIYWFLLKLFVWFISLRDIWLGRTLKHVAAVFQHDIQSYISPLSCVFISPAPSPTTAVHYLAAKCVDTSKHRQETKWFMPWGQDQCEKIRSFEEAMAKKIEANNIVFAVHIPLHYNEMSPWFQFMLVILQFDIAFKMYNQIGEKQSFVLGFRKGLRQHGSCFSFRTQLSIHRRGKKV